MRWLTPLAADPYDVSMDWPQTWAIAGVLGSLILGVGGIAITVLIGMRSENRIAHEQLGKRIDEGNASVNTRIDDLRELVLKLVPGVPGRSHAD